jgi:hypothetical protein
MAPAAAEGASDPPGEDGVPIATGTALALAPVGEGDAPTSVGPGVLPPVAIRSCVLATGDATTVTTGAATDPLELVDDFGAAGSPVTSLVVPAGVAGCVLAEVALATADGSGSTVAAGTTAAGAAAIGPGAGGAWILRPFAGAVGMDESSPAEIVSEEEPVVVDAVLDSVVVAVLLEPLAAGEGAVD